ncbi:hypothetical protein AXF42_Ash003927 [Apostasia shenzhenica]|uniref:Uncharacterized protein n=1 Tax=Apostasia shenzhenica TaxID=1088818 RepID=A0A2I0AIC4_9ASPA|nr:hypothetical protein AXF42_Ash003927 [Apostasia shenzhenica]
MAAGSTEDRQHKAHRAHKSGAFAKKKDKSSKKRSEASGDERQQNPKVAGVIQFYE